MPNTYGSAIYGTDVYGPNPTLPANTVAPSATGSALVSSVLVVTNGTWTDSGHISYAYQWQSSIDGVTSWGNIGGATSSTYMLKSTDVPNFIRCVVTDTDSIGSTAAPSNVVGAVAWPQPVNTVLPIISGTAQVGAVVAATSGSWTDDGSPIFTYQWQDSPDGATGWGNIATGPEYFVEPSRQSEYLRCVVTNSDAGGATQAVSNVLGPVSAGVVVGLPLVPHPSHSITLTPAPPND